MSITTEQIEALRTEAAQAGDLDAVDVCEEALDGDTSARREVAAMIRDAAAMDND